MPLYFFTIVVLVGIDQGIKFLVRANLSAESNVELIPNLIHLTYQENKGISFSMFANLSDSYRVPLLAGISAIVVIGLIVYVIRRWSALFTGEKWGFSLILSGAIGNLLDRAIRAQVTDYMHFHFFQTSFFVNNFADDLISIGFVLLLLYSFRKVKT